LNCGSVNKIKESAVRYQVSSLTDLINIMRPKASLILKLILYVLLNQNTLRVFGEICSLLEAKEHKNDLGLKYIIDLSYKMNKDGKSRKLTKEEYIDILNSRLFAEASALAVAKAKCYFYYFLINSPTNPTFKYI
jgi:hypothetical protein